MECPFCETECDDRGGYGNYFCEKCESECINGIWQQGLAWNRVDENGELIAKGEEEEE